MRRLVGLRHHAHVVELEVLALERKRLLSPGALDNLERLSEALAALGVRHAVMRIHPSEPAATDAEDEPALADVVDGGRLLGQLQRMAQWQDLDGGADLDAPRARGNCASQGQRRRENRAFRREVQLRQPYGIEAPAFSVVDQLECSLEGLRLTPSRRTLELVENAEFHRRSFQVHDTSAAGVPVRWA